ncbi:DUF3857 domain-containing transglutaminase family protein [Pontibacter anaerobius]|uniref:DUF3857 domain-containing transglutaminase family protein n=1 Tax=Pontibacter anaerobius TaxID=2993940 RepID=A0ABT3RCL7_9BACT|nr:DUF3857 domain-containing transglutaminase family protein [Pontibacter anaerobius]MCX2739613.1 DUF3857 domain-containing transglutaminase family protein [Pontibacter anaerobius]
MLRFNRNYNWLCGLLCWLLLLAPQVFAAGSLEELAKGANAIIRAEETVFTVNSTTSGVLRFKSTITILNKYGDHHATLYVPYNKMSKVNAISGTSYDRFGKRIKKLKNSDIKDVSAISSISVYEDSRVKIASLEYNVYPYTVEFEYEVSKSNMMFYPRWYPQGEEKLSVERASLQVQVPLGTKLRYLENNLPKKVEVGSNTTHEIYTWEVSNLKPVSREPYGPSFSELVPMVLTGPNEFEVDGYKGSMATWKDFGLWAHKLNQGRDELPAETVAKLKNLTANAKSTEEKVRMVYDYMQGKTRYVSIQLGIGSWQPFEASFVDDKGYGDCKALSNYTQAMLKAVGVESYYALINAGEGTPDIKIEFPSSQFNHAVLCVPMAQDTMWLECTSQTAAAGYNGSFTGDRHALLITPEGGKLVKTTAYTATENQQIRSMNVRLDEAGGGIASVSTRYTGTQQESRDGVIQNLKPEEQRKWLYENTTAPPFEISKYSFTQKKERVPSVTENLELSMRQCATLSGKRMFISPNLMSKWTYVPDQKEKRLTDVVRIQAYMDVDTVEIEVPAGYSVEYLPGEVKYKSVFGEYAASVKVDGQRVTYVRRMQMHKGRFAPETFAQLVEFYNSIIKADAEQVVFVKNVQ